MQQQVKPVIPSHQAVTIKPHATLAGVDAANGQCWYEIRAQSAARVEIYLYDVIGGWGITAQQFINDCREAGVFEASSIDLHIHSPGGDVMQGFAIFNTLSRLKAKLDTTNRFLPGGGHRNKNWTMTLKHYADNISNP